MAPVRSVGSIPFILLPPLGLPAAEGVQNARPVSLFSQLVREGGTRSGSILAYRSADALYGSHGSSSLYPRIYGLAHCDSEAGIDAMRELISRCRAQGARSIGLELAPSTWNDERIDNYFKTLGLHAVAIGMEVIFLLTDELLKNIRVVFLSGGYIGSDGRFDADTLFNRILDIQDDIDMARRSKGDFFKAPEMGSVADIPYLEWHLSRLKAVRKFLAEIDYDMDAFSRAWTERVGNASTDTMSEIIVERRPDVVFMGYGHAVDVPPIAGYEVVDVRSLSAPDDSSESSPEKSSEFYKAIARKHHPFAAARFFQNVGPMVRRMTGTDDHEITAAVLDRAIRLDPDIYKLTMRAFWYEDPLWAANLSPKLDIGYLKMSVEEARRKIQKTLRKANRRRRIKKWLWPF